MQAAGRLTGQDLLQFINAGFNPLQEIAAKTGTTIGELKTKMEKGGISADMVTKAFESATGAGGKFNGMMEQIGQTSYGKLQILEGQWENFKINVGNSMMPLAEGLMDMTSKTAEWLGITKTAPQILSGEQSQISLLVNSITGLNEGNVLRTKLLKDLQTAYPDLFSNLNLEKTSNLELLKSLNDINAAYRDKIALGTTALQKSSLAKEEEYTLGLATRAQQQLDYMKAGNTGFFQTGMFSPYMEGFDNVKIRKAGFNEKSIEGLQGFVNFAMGDLQRLSNERLGLDKKEGFQKAASQGAELLNLIKAPGKLAEIFKDRPADFAEFRKLQPTGKIENIGKMYELVNRVTPAGIKSTDNGTGAVTGNGTGKAVNDVVRGIASGGPRTININGVKFAENINIDASNGKDPMINFESRLQEMFLRVLNSGATVN